MFREFVLFAIALNLVEIIILMMWIVSFPEYSKKLVSKLFNFVKFIRDEQEVPPASVPKEPEASGGIKIHPRLR